MLPCAEEETGVSATPNTPVTVLKVTEWLAGPRTLVPQTYGKLSNHGELEYLSTGVNSVDSVLQM